jgi:hypothetical protein
MITKTFDRPQRSAVYPRQFQPPQIRLAFKPKGRRALVALLIWFMAPVMMLFLLLARDGALVVGAAASYPDPFAVHSALMAGQSVQAVEGSTCNQGSPREPNKVCAVYPEDGLFHLISYTEKQGGIVETSFYSDSLQLGKPAAGMGRAGLCTAQQRRAHIYAGVGFAAVQGFGHAHPERARRLCAHRDGDSYNGYILIPSAAAIATISGAITSAGRKFAMRGRLMSSSVRPSPSRIRPPTAVISLIIGSVIT